MFIIQADLTHRREDLLAFAKEQQTSWERAQAVVKIVGVDKNCALYAISINGELFHFSSELEFHTAVISMENSCMKILQLHKHLRTEEFGYNSPAEPICYKNCCKKAGPAIVQTQVTYAKAVSTTSTSEGEEGK